MPRKKTPKSDKSNDLIPSLSVCQTDEDDCEICTNDFNDEPAQQEIKEIEFQEGSLKKPDVKSAPEGKVHSCEIESLRIRVAELEMKVSELQAKATEGNEVDQGQPTVVDDCKFDQIVATAVATAIQQERAWVNSQILLKLAQARR